MNSIKVFEYGESTIRSMQEDGVVFFVAKDVASALGYAWDRNLINKVPPEWKGVKQIHTPGGEQGVACLTEEGVYYFVARSDLPKAIPFQKWIAGEVIPSIRKTGKYSIVKDMTGGFVVPRTMAEALRLAADQAEQMEKMLPKVEAAEALTRCDKTMSITETAKHFGLHPKKQVFPYLRARGLLTSRDLPSQTAIDGGIMTVRQNPVGNGDFYSQAVVEKSALDMWRTTIVPKIIEWTEATV